MSPGEQGHGDNLPKPKIKPEEIPPVATDAEIALFLISHIERPCEVEVSPGEKVNIREFYIREAERVLPGMTNVFAREALEKKLENIKNKFYFL